ncbi:hypothetical protein TVAG_305460 [Trichomonas vaginalis G3]|uniref:L-type lectin-like domain-containing protein n=1 Tax=Trichomonas vaginalis (strain ATCC PRA-98 / G3) TaxID=412133 RepID=A2ERC0_TRIV3|nr:lectin, mannose-binding, 1 family [Trichomonas vaginalis G3]EAY04796.1 hypothetical protein TVAG_305460 [Trichomonas vaginalis G3]KAI5490997.1 lectin, mannose-binding, 1 family [Trichomonas vaginalis G3]|eukprot:XP_001317019.1 hypothetical protein [Trichomonas vaginalis G3]
MFSIFSTLTASDTVENRKFVEFNNNFTGSWEIGGVSKKIGNDFYLIDNSTLSYGGIYYTNRLSAKQFEIKIALRYIPGEKSTGMNAIWITKDYHQESQVFGGPLSFNGIALLSSYNGTHLDTEFRKNDKKGRFVSYQYFPSSFIPVVDNKVTYRIVYKDGIVNVYITSGDKETHAFSQTPISDIRKYFLSITGRSAKKITQIIVDSAEYNTLFNDDEILVKTVAEMHIEDDEDSEPKPTRTPKPNPTPKPVDSYTYEDVLDEISIFDIFSTALTTTADMRQLIWNEMVPFSDAWQRRSIGICRKSGNLRASLLSTLNSTYQQMQELKDQIEMDLVYLRNDMQDIESELYHGVSQGYHLNQKLREEKYSASSGVSHTLLVFGIVEAVLVIIGIFIKIFCDGYRSPPLYRK